MPPTQIRFTLEASPAAVHSARQRISATVRSWGVPCDEDLSFRLELVVSELLTDGLMRAGGPLAVEVALEQHLLVIEVLVGGSAVPPGEPAPDESGYGPTLVDACCLFNGSARTASGNRHWAVLALPATPVRTVDHGPEDIRHDRAPADSARWSISPAGARLLTRMFPATVT